MINLALYIIVIPLTLVLFYYYFLAAVAYSNIGKPKKQSGSKHTKKFVIIIPAHNEEKTLHTALDSCGNLEYQKTLFDVVVVADNCTDQTANIARNYGALCLERHDNVKVGKGYALKWVLEHDLIRKYDAIVILDADCTLTSNALEIISNLLDSGHEVLQAKYTVSNPDDCPISYVSAIGSIIENDLFYSPKSKLNLSVFLRGTGMVFASEILEKIPWSAHSIVEDVEYTMLLLENNIAVKFVDEVSVNSNFPTTIEQLRIQRIRWASGNIGIGKLHAIKWMINGLRTRNYRLFDAGWTFLTLSRPLLIFLLAMALGLGITTIYLEPTFYSNLTLYYIIFLCFIYMFYILLGVFRLGINKSRLYLLAKSPLIIIELIVISVLGLFGVKQHEWSRTPR